MRESELNSDRRATDFLSHPAVWFILAVLSFMVLAYQIGYLEINDEGFWTLTDDIMISQRYAQNQVEGNGLVYNKGEYVEGFSEPVVVFLFCLPLELLGLDVRHLGLPIWILNAVLHGLICLMIVFHKGLRWQRPSKAAMLAGLIYLSLPVHCDLAPSGFSVYLQIILVLYLLPRIYNTDRLFYLLLAVMPLVHSILYPIWGAVILVRLYAFRSQLKSEIPRLALVALPLLAYMSFRVLYYGDIFPNTYYLKSTGLAQFERGLMYLGGFLKSLSPLILVLAIAVFYRLRNKGFKRIPAYIFILGIYVCFVVKIGGDLFGMRMLLPLAALMIYALASLSDDIVLPKVAVVFLITLSFFQLGLNTRKACLWYMHDVEPCQKWYVERIALGESIRDNAVAGDRVALFGLGYTGYIAGLHVIDMLGKVDAHIARAECKPDWKLGHQKDDPDYVLKLAPEYIECGIPQSKLDDLEFLEKERAGKWGWQANLALREEFRRSYVQVESSCGPLPLYVRKDIDRRIWHLDSDVFCKTENNLFVMSK